MLDCKKCGFRVSKDMTFSINQNTCPSCGYTLMSNAYLLDVKTIKNQILSSRICDGKLSQEEVHLLSIFIKNTYLPEAKNENVTSENESTEGEEVAGYYDNETIDIEKIRDEIRNEAISSLSREEVVSDVESEIERKKALARNSPTLGKTGARVNRLSQG